MSRDEEAIRELVATWLSATRAGDTATVLGLMTDDVVFLVPGRAFGKAAFAEAARAQAAEGLQFDGCSEIEELQVHGDWAFMRTRLTVTAAPPDGGEAITRSGYTLTILAKQQGRWRLARDANLLAAAADAGDA